MGLFNSKKKRIEELEKDLAYVTNELDRFKYMLQETREELDKCRTEFPLQLNQIVYDVQLRNEKGRYTKKNPSREYSVVSEVVVTTKNYFNLVERYFNGDVYISYVKAEQYLDEICK